jgi:hypothetical protein
VLLFSFVGLTRSYPETAAFQVAALPLTAADSISTKKD